MAAIDEIRTLLITKLAQRRLTQLTGAQFKVSIAALTDANANIIADSIQKNNACDLGDLILKGIKVRLTTTAATDIDAILADSQISVAEITALQI
jgi:hypothetical protein